MNDSYIIRLCTVLNVQDDAYGLRIKVKLPYEDNGIDDEKDLPYCFPLLPKLIHVNPQIGELVLVILQSQGEAKGNRFFIGPVISQPYFNSKDHANQAQSLLIGDQPNKPLPHPITNTANDGTLPDRDDIAIIGRQNTDIILKPNQLQLRCGFKQNPTGPAEQTLVFNKFDLAYIQMKYGKYKDAYGGDFNSVINVVADRINLLSHDGKKQFNLCKPDELLDDDELSKVLKNGHPLIYGDELVSFLQQFINVFKHHEHDWARMKPDLLEPHEAILNIDLNKMLSKVVHIN